MKKRLRAGTTVLIAGLAAALSVPSPAQAATSPVLDLGIAEGAIVDKPITITPTLAAGAEVTRMELYTVGRYYGEVGGRDRQAPWRIYWNPMNYMDDRVTLTLFVWDAAGNMTASAPVTVYVDHQGPDYTLQNQHEPGWGYFLSVRTPIRISVTDPAGVRRVEMLQDGRLVRSVPFGDRISGPVSLALDPATRNGDVDITIRLVDRFGNVTNSIFWVTVDNTAPTGVFRPGGTYLRGAFTAWAYESWDNYNVFSLASYLDDHKGGGIVDFPGSVRVDSRAVKDGRHTLTWEIADLAGNMTVTRRTVTVDNTAPSITLTRAPKNRAKLTKKVILKAKASDRYGVTKVQMLVNGKIVATDTKAGYRFTLNPKKYGKKFTVRLRAYDRAGNVTYSAKRTYRR